MLSTSLRHEGKGHLSRSTAVQSLNHSLTANYSAMKRGPLQARSKESWVFLNGQIWGPIREETNEWFARVCTGLETPHATAEDGHRNLVLTMAMDLSSKRGQMVDLPFDLEEFYK